MVHELETDESGVSWLIVGGGGRQVRQRVGKSRERGSKSNGDWCGWTVALGYELVECSPGGRRLGNLHSSPYAPQNLTKC